MLYMVRTFSSNRKIYSVDMMFAYINIYKPKSTSVDIDDLLHNLEYKGWGDPIKSILYSPLDVLKNPNKKQYKKEIQRIENADLKYPIIIYNNNIVDGVHRLTKANLQGKKKIKAYIFNSDLMKKFLINNNRDWEKVDNMEAYELIQLFHKRFD